MVLVTGANGFAGSWLVCHLLAEGYTVKAARRHNADMRQFQFISRIFFGENTKPLTRLSWVHADLLDLPALEEAISGCRQVYHTAAVVSFSKKDRQRMWLTNVEGTANVVNVCLDAGIEKLCHFSSVAALGRSPDGNLITEETPWEASKLNTTYAKTKHRAELEVWRGIAEGLNAVILNPSIVNGPGNWHRGPCRIYRNISKGLPFYTHGGGGYVDVRDVCRAALLLMQGNATAQRYLLNGDNLLYRDFFSQVAAALGVKAPRFYVSPWLSRLGLPLETLRSKLAGSEPVVTTELAITAHIVSRYSALKVKQELGFNFTPIAESVKWTCGCFGR